MHTTFMRSHPTSKQNIALTLISRRLGESFINRTPEDYEAIKAKLPPIKVLHGIAGEIPCSRNRDNLDANRECCLRQQGINLAAQCF